MRGIDISNWQKTITPSKMGVDFCIVKATEGKSFVDKTCDKFVQDMTKNNMLWGFYHFARENNPEVEAKHFYDSCKGYFKKGIPVLDYETTSSNNVKWCEKFIKKVYDLSGVWCVIYISASRCKEYKGSWIPEKCGLWVAGYPKNYDKWINAKMPYNISPWKNAIIWQFTSSLKLKSYSGNLDGNIAYITKDEWLKYANSSEKIIENINSKSIDTLVKETLTGKYGFGTTRKKALGNMYDKVQGRINKLYQIAGEVIAGKWGNGTTRKTKLTNAGYNYELVQMIVNEKIGGK